MTYQSELWGGGDHKKPVARCYTTHPGLKVGFGGAFIIYGGSASNPVVKDADIYVALQGGSTSGLVGDPWEESPVIEVQFEIFDGMAPRAAELGRFKKLIDYLCNQLQSGAKVHVGCIGGHGRTGLVLAAVTAQLGEKDAINYVRKAYCKKAVETSTQVEFLVKHYGVLPAAGSRTEYTSTKKAPVKPDTGGRHWWDADQLTDTDDQFQRVLGTARAKSAQAPAKAPEPAQPPVTPSKSAKAASVPKTGKRIAPVNTPRNLFRKPKAKK